MIVGCSERPETTAPVLNSSDGISSIINDANIETDRQVTDPRLNALFSDASPAISISDSYYDVFSIRITWGNLTDTTNVNNTSTNWNGSVFVNAVGALVVRSTIDFEHGQDSVNPARLQNRSRMGFADFR
ncbi:MAG: hypothetical protein IIB00_09145 [candidate division Zixibacteria bacterium]|nr:hypothetical protein [candidate division Zixibacteria bacterium]